MFCTSSQDEARRLDGRYLGRGVLEKVRVNASEMTIPGPPKLRRPDRRLFSSELSTFRLLGLP